MGHHASVWGRFGAAPHPRREKGDQRSDSPRFLAHRNCSGIEALAFILPSGLIESAQTVGHAGKAILSHGVRLPLEASAPSPVSHGAKTRRFDSECSRAAATAVCSLETYEQGDGANFYLEGFAINDGSANPVSAIYKGSGASSRKEEPSA